MKMCKTFNRESSSSRSGTKKQSVLNNRRLARWASETSNPAFSLKLFTTTIKTRKQLINANLALLILSLLLCSCANDPSIYNHIRANAIHPSKPMQQSVRLGTVESHFNAIATEPFKAAITKSLLGNNYLGEHDKYQLNAKLVKGNISWGLSNTADISVDYEVIDTLTGESVWSTHIESTATATTTLNIFKLIGESVRDAAVGFTTFDSGIVTTDPYVSSPKVDAEFAYPELGAPINAQDGGRRQQYVAYTALRKNFVELLNQLNRKFVK
jgi:hypothetical protein